MRLYHRQASAAHVSAASKGFCCETSFLSFPEACKGIQPYKSGFPRHMQGIEIKNLTMEKAAEILKGRKVTRRGRRPQKAVPDGMSPKSTDYC